MSVGAVDAYVAAAPAPSRVRLAELVELIRAELGDAEECLRYAMPTWRTTENLVQLAGYAGHVGLYPGPEAIQAFTERLAGFETSKGAIRLPLDRPLPVELVRDIVRQRVAAAAQRAASHPGRATARSSGA
jgi:uncharacterized protein YdhG (YjbR/CyaY superfamily)